MGDGTLPAGPGLVPGRHLRVKAVVAILLAGGAAACASVPRSAPAAAPVADFDPAGRYAVTMSSATMVSEGEMEITLLRDGHGGTLSVGATHAIIVAVEAGVGHMTVQAQTERGRLILRLARDGDAFSGNWILGSQRGTVFARRVNGGRS